MIKSTGSGPIPHRCSCRSAPTIRGSRGSRTRTRTAATSFADQANVHPARVATCRLVPTRAQASACRVSVGRGRPAGPGNAGAFPSPFLPQMRNTVAGEAPRPAPPPSCSSRGSGSPSPALERTWPVGVVPKPRWPLREVPSQVTTLTDEDLANHVDDHSFHPRTLHEPYNRRRSLIPATLHGVRRSMRTCSCAAGSAAGNGAAPRGPTGTASTCREFVPTRHSRRSRARYRGREASRRGDSNPQPPVYKPN